MNDLIVNSIQVSTLEARSRDNGADTWLAALNTLRERSLHLERSLSAETRVKLDLFSAVGEAKRQLGLRESTYSNLQLRSYMSLILY